MLAPLLAFALQAGAEAPIIVSAPLPATPQTPATVLVEPVAMMIATFDADDDALVDRSELLGGVSASFAAIDVAQNGAKAGRLRYIAFADWAERFLGDRAALPSPFEVDRDQDGAITLDELQDQFNRLFARYDRDQSKTISRGELVTYRAGPIGADGPTQGKPGDRRPPPTSRDGGAPPSRR